MRQFDTTNVNRAALYVALYNEMVARRLAWQAQNSMYEPQRTTPMPLQEAEHWLAVATNLSINFDGINPLRVTFYNDYIEMSRDDDDISKIINRFLEGENIQNLSEPVGTVTHPP